MNMPPGYDAWKTRSPDDDLYRYDRYREDDFEPEDECEHEFFDVEWDGLATCERCGHSWGATLEQVRDHERRVRANDEWERKQARREFWKKLTAPIRWPIYWVLNRIWPKQSCRVLTDDEIPF